MDYHYAKRRDPRVNEYFDKETMDAWVKWDELVFKPGKIDTKTKQLIAVACTYMTRCPYCIEGHAKAAIKEGATKEELAEVIQIAMALSSGAAVAHRNFALDV
jgi:AhpD family alkylhydroperoxidase